MQCLGGGIQPAAFSFRIRHFCFEFDMEPVKQPERIYNVLSLGGVRSVSRVGDHEAPNG